MTATRPYPVDKAFPNAADLRKAQSAVFPREGVFPDPTTVASGGIAYAGTGWNVGARPFTANLKRGGAPFSQTYGAAQIANDGNVPTAWLLPGAPSSGSVTSLLWIRANDPTQGEATVQIGGEVDPAGNPRPRAVPTFGVTTGTTTVAPILPAGAELISTVTIASTSTSAATSTIVQSYDFAGVLGGTSLIRTKAALDAAVAAGTVAIGETFLTLDTLQTFVLGRVDGNPRLAERGLNLLGTRQDFAGGTIVAQGTNRSLYSVLAPCPVDGMAKIQVGAYLAQNTTNTWAGEFSVILNGTRYAADTVRTHNHARAGMIYVSGEIDLPLFGGVIHSLDVRYIADANASIASVELWDSHVTISLAF